MDEAAGLPAAAPPSAPKLPDDEVPDVPKEAVRESFPCAKCGKVLTSKKVLASHVKGCKGKGAAAGKQGSLDLEASA